ncbi:phytanoyl-CoA dioxygenase family protein [Spirosoma jeollabukense]
MNALKFQIDKINENGFTIINDIFSEEEINNLTQIIDQATHSNTNFRKENDLFAIRNFIGEVPQIEPYLWTEKLNSLIDTLLGASYFVTKAIYFNKPALSNWLVPWHQDTKISVDARKETEGFSQWTLKQGLQAVQPTRDYLDDLFTIRIHLDACDQTNGALKVVPKSHKLGVLKDNEILQLDKTETICNVQKGGLMIMKPLLLHSSSKSTSEQNRRVIHLEFSSKQLPNGLHWREWTDRKNARYVTS